jgi:uncharacterized membrane protein
MRNPSLKYVVLFLLISSMALVAFAYAPDTQRNSFKYTVFNHTDENAWTVWDPGDITKGWYKIEPGSKKEFPSSSNTVYFYAYTENTNRSAGGSTSRWYYPPDKSFEVRRDSGGWCSGDVGG